jgi:hypothetical protein
MGYLLAHWNAAARVIGVAPTPPPTQQSLAAGPEIAAVPTGATGSPATPAAGTDPADEPERIVIDPEIGQNLAVPVEGGSFGLAGEIDHFLHGFAAA